MFVTHKTLQIEDVKYVRIYFLKRVEDLAKPLHEDEDAFIPFDSCLRRNGNPKIMTSSFGVPTMFTAASKHYKAVNSF